MLLLLRGVGGEERAIYEFILGGVQENSAKCEEWEPVLNEGLEPSTRGLSFGIMLLKL